MFIDTHAHLNTIYFYRDLSETIARAQENNISKIIDIAVNLESAKKSIQLSDRYESIYSTIGFHPKHAANMLEKHIIDIKDMCDHHKVVAVGEIGLDYTIGNADKDVQLLTFREQVQLARLLKLPIIIHSHDETHKDILKILREEKAGSVGGVIHSFSSELETAKRYLDMGFYLSFGGIITRPNTQLIREVVQYMPIDRMLLETDAPFLTPYNLNKKRNEPSFLIHTASLIAEIRKIDLEDLGGSTTRNAKNLFNF